MHIYLSVERSKTKMNRKELIAVLDAALAIGGFAREKYDWYLSLEETILVINLQQSEYSGQFYLNFGVWLRCADPNVKMPPERLCQVRFRLEDVVPRPAKEPWVRKLLNLDARDISKEARAIELTSLIRDVALPNFLGCSTLSNLRKLEQNGQLPPATTIVGKQIINRMIGNSNRHVIRDYPF